MEEIIIILDKNNNHLMAYYNIIHKFQFLKLLRYLFGLFPNNIRKHLNLYELREIYHFLLKIFKSNSHPVNKSSLLLKKYSIFCNEFLNLVIINCYQPLLLLAKIWGVIVRIASLGDPVYRLFKR